MKLIEIWKADIDKAYNLQNSFKKDENGFCNDAYGLSKKEYVDYLETCQNNSLGINLKEGYVPDTKYVLVDDEDNYVGIFNLRHELNDFLRNGPGHIGYGISKNYRNKGYATKGLALCLKKAKEKGIDVVYLAAHKDNYPSIKVQLNNGAYIDHEDEKEVYTRIKL